LIRLDLIESTKKKDGVNSINYMMAKTYSWRRQEVFAKSPQVAEFKERWPTLFEIFQVKTVQKLLMQPHSKYTELYF
jgi:ABC-type uncharacterized transport system ATPase subunit